MIKPSLCSLPQMKEKHREFFKMFFYHFYTFKLYTMVYSPFLFVPYNDMGNIRKELSKAMPALLFVCRVPFCAFATSFE